MAALLPRPSAESDKYRRGVLGVSRAAPGSPARRRCPSAARCAAAPGMIRLVIGRARRETRPAALAGGGDHRGRPGRTAGWRRPGRSAAEAVGAAGQVQAWVAGPGWARIDDAAGAAGQRAADDLPVLVDADGIRCSRPTSARCCGGTRPTLITPHAGELARLLRCDRAAIEASRLALRPAGRRRAGPDRAAEGIDHGDSRARPAAPVAGERHRHELAGHGWLRRRAVRPDRLAARAGPGPAETRRGRRLPARPGRQAGGGRPDGGGLGWRPGPRRCPDRLRRPDRRRCPRPSG